MKSLLQKPSAFVPIILSGIAAIMLIGFLIIAMVGNQPISRAEDEGIGAHLFQLLMGAQVIIILFFVAKWLPRSPKQTGAILALQIILALGAMAPVFILGI